MRIMLSNLRLTPIAIESSVKMLLTFSIVATLSACGSIRYNGITAANTVFDIFSFTDDEKQTEQSLAAAEEAEQAEKQRELLLKQQQAKLAEQPAEDTYERLAQGEVLPLSTENKEAQVDSNMVDTKTEAARAVAENAMNSEQANSQQMMPTEPQAMLVAQEEQASELEQNSVAVNSAINAPSEMNAVSDAQPVMEQDTMSPMSDTGASNIAAIEEVNRMTEENPTAAMVTDYQVLPEVSAKVDLSVPNEILLLATPAVYHPEESEYGMWKIAKGDDSLYRENCTLASATMQVSFENYSTQVWLSVVGNDLLVNSTTNIDINRPRVGIKLDNGALQPFTKKHFATNAVWAGDLSSALKRNKKLSVVLSGNEIGNRVQEVSVELDDLKRAYSEYTKCNATTQIGSL